MTRRSRIRKRERQRKKVEQQKLAIQIPVLRKASTAELFAEIERRSQALADIFEGKY